MSGASYTHDTIVRLCGQPVKVTVFYQLGPEKEPNPEIECIISENENDLTHMLDVPILDNIRVVAWSCYDPGWQDPIRTAMFGLVSPNPINGTAHVGRAWTTPIRAQLSVQGLTFGEHLVNEICTSPGFVAVCRDEACRDD